MQTLPNQEVIAVDQDVLRIQGTKIMGGNFTSCASEPACVCVWIRRLVAGRFALMLANAGTGTTDYGAVTCALLAATTTVPVAKYALARSVGGYRRQYQDWRWTPVRNTGACSSRDARHDARLLNAGYLLWAANSPSVRLSK